MNTAKVCLLKKKYKLKPILTTLQIFRCIRQVLIEVTTWKVSKYGVISGRYFPVFGLNMKIYGLNLRIQSEYRKIRTRNYSVFGLFSRSDCDAILIILIIFAILRPTLCCSSSIFRVIWSAFSLSNFKPFFKKGLWLSKKWNISKDIMLLSPLVPFNFLMQPLLDTGHSLLYV